MDRLASFGHTRAGQVLSHLGFAALLIGAIDPMEGAFVILPGTALVALGAFLHGADRQTLVYRLASFLAVAIGVGAMIVFSAFGGIGGSTDLSAWWGLLILPYPVGWIMAICGHDTPRWVLWLGIVVSLWFYTVLGLVAWKTVSDPQTNVNLVAGILLAGVGVVTFAGCVWRLTTNRAVTRGPAHRRCVNPNG